MATSTLTNQGRTTIPKEIRDLLGVEPGDKLDFVIEGDGRVVLRPLSLDVRELRGVLQRRGSKTVLLEDMERAIAEGATRTRK